MSVINQMLRELDARGNMSAELPMAPIRPSGVKRHPAWLALGGAGLAAAGATAIYWMLPAAPTNAPQNGPVIPRQETKAVNTPSAATAPAIPSAPQPAVAATEPSPVAFQQPQGRVPARETARGLAERPLPAPPGPSAPFLSLDQGTLQAEPAVVKKMTALSPEAEAQQHYDDAQVLRRAGKFDAAIGKYRQALERNQGMTGARIQLARLLQEKGQVDAALSLLQAGYEQRADDGLAIATGRLLADLGQREAALDWLQRGQAGLRPADHALTGALLSQAHRQEEASRAYQRALAADPGQGGWLLGLGLTLEAQGRLDEARTAYRNALERGQFKPEVMQFLRERSGLAGP
ncbi:tetratricopeptide repeat protein [Thiobacillus sp.]